MPGISAGTAKPDLLPLQKNDVDPGFCQFKRGRQTSVTCTDDTDVGLDAPG